MNSNMLGGCGCEHTFLALSMHERHGYISGSIHPPPSDKQTNLWNECNKNRLCLWRRSPTPPRFVVPSFLYLWIHICLTEALMPMMALPSWFCHRRSSEGVVQFYKGSGKPQLGWEERKRSPRLKTGCISWQFVRNGLYNTAAHTQMRFPTCYMSNTHTRSLSLSRSVPLSSLTHPRHPTEWATLERNFLLCMEQCTPLCNLHTDFYWKNFRLKSDRMEKLVRKSAAGLEPLELQLRSRDVRLSRTCICHESLDDNAALSQ